MKVLFLSGWYPDRFRPGTGNYVREQALAVSELVSVAVLAPRTPLEWLRAGHKPEPLKPLPHFPEYRPQLPWWGIKQFAAKGFATACKRVLMEISRDFGVPDVIHAHVGVPAGLLALQLQKKWGSRIVLTEHVGPVETAFRHWGKNCALEVWDRVDALVAVSPFQSGQLRSVGVQRAEIKIIGNVVNLTRTLENSFTMSPSKQITLLSVGEFGLLKGTPSLLGALSKVISRGQWDLQLRVAGPPATPNWLREIDALGLANRIRFLGQLSSTDMASEYARCDGLIHTSSYESFSLAVAEALAFGKPVIITPCGGPEWFVHEKNGRIASGFTADQVASALADLLEARYSFNPTKIASEIHNRFCSKEIATQLAELYQSI